MATAELGEQLLARTAASVADRVERGRKEEPPLGAASRPPLPLQTQEL
jgi:hypothetical protein